MSLRIDGKFRCDRCGVEVGNGGVLEAMFVGDLDPDNPGHVRNLHFCRDREEGGSQVKGCSRKILTPSNLANYNETKESDNGRASGDRREGDHS